MKYRLLICFYWLPCVVIFAQPRPYGHEQAIHQDSNIFVAWATKSTIARSFQNIADVSLGYTTIGDINSATGKAGQNGVVSLGDGGSVILQFDKPIKNGPGADFAVFENGIGVLGDTTLFMELAFVEVSSDGVNYVRFPAYSFTPVNKQMMNGEGNSPNMVHNLAGRYAATWGTPFDLEVLKGVSGINVNFITHIKIIDVVGSLDDRFATYDVLGNKINDPFPTPFASGGFDLDAVGVIHQQLELFTPQAANQPTIQFPSLIKSDESFTVQHIPAGCKFTIYDMQGKILLQQTINEQMLTIPSGTLSPGFLMAAFQVNGEIWVNKIMVY
jgi:hypothetical protein